MELKDNGNGKLMKSVRLSLLLLCLFLVRDNFSYLFHYLPHHDEYQKVDAYIVSLNPRASYCKVTIIVSEQTVKGKVKHGANEKMGQKITVGYCAERSPRLVRICPVITGSSLFVVIILILGNLRMAMQISRNRKTPEI